MTLAALVDTHCHLEPEPGEDAATTVARARDAGLVRLIDVGIDAATSAAAAERAARFEDVR